MLALPRQPKKAPSAPQQPHLIQLLGQKPPAAQEQQPLLQCRYGIWCAHLRANGACQLPHRKNHYLLLNLVPAECAIDDDAIDEEKLSKRERKEKKIIEKTISENIDVQALVQREEQRRKDAAAEAKREIFEKLDEKEKKLFDLASSLTAEDFFSKLNALKATDNAYEVRKRSLIQLKKKNDKLYAEIIDKEYRIANRLIKESLKNPKSSLLEVYLDINHNTVASVRDYFEDYLSPDAGIPQEDGQPRLHLASLLRSLFLRETSQFTSQYYLVRPKSSLPAILSNIEFYNLMVPYLHSQATPFNKYLHLDCQESLTLTSLSQLLSKDYAATFHVKCKPFPQYPFGQLQANLKAFAQWAGKIAGKYREGNKDSNIVAVFSNVAQLFPNQAALEFQQQKLKERRLAFQALLKIFQPVVYFLSDSASKQVRQSLSQLLELSSEGSCKYARKLEVLQEK